MATKTLNAGQQVAQLRDKLTFWENNLRANEAHYMRTPGDYSVSLVRMRAQLDIIESVRDLLN
jgi:hypothetical protein